MIFTDISSPVCSDIHVLRRRRGPGATAPVTFAWVDVDACEQGERTGRVARTRRRSFLRRHGRSSSRQPIGSRPQRRAPPNIFPPSPGGHGAAPPGGPPPPQAPPRVVPPP